MREARGGALDVALLMLGSLPLLVPRVGLAVDVRDVAPLDEVARLAPRVIEARAELRPSGPPLRAAAAASWQETPQIGRPAEQVPGWQIAAEALGGLATSRGLAGG